MEPMIRLEGISKEYKNQDIPALSDVSLEIYPGEFVAITGASGSGKSTLLNVLGLLTQPDSGTYAVSGQDTAQLSEANLDSLRSKTFGFIFQSAHVLGYETVYNNAMLGLRTQNRPLEERQAGAQTWIEQVGLTHRSKALGHQLSGGEKQRLAIARAMATQPDILLADEPTGNLDSKNAQLVFDELKLINQTGTTVIVITHDPALAAQAHRQIVLKDGRVIEDSSPELEERFTAAASEAKDNSDTVRRTSPLIDDAIDALNYISLTPFKALTLIFAFMLGIGGLVLAQGLSQTASHQVAQSIAKAALDDVKVDFTPSAEVDTETAPRVTDAVDSVSQYRGVKTVSIERTLATGDMQPRLLAYETSRFSGSVYAVDSKYFTYLELPQQNHHALWQLDSQYPVAFVGKEAAEELGIGRPESGNGLVWLGSSPVTVLGILDDNSPRDNSVTRNIYVNASFVAESDPLVVTESGTRLVIRTEPGYPAPLAEALPVIIAPQAPEAVLVSTVGDLRNIQRGISTDLATLVGGVSWLLIFLATLTSATTLYTSVQGRRAEVALRRAIGASRTSILRIFLFEGTLLGMAGGIAGSSLGLMALVGISKYLDWDPVISMQWAFTGVGLGALTGMIAAAYPALLAARAQPAEAIRS